MGYRLPDVTQLSNLSQHAQVEVLNNLFEKHPAVHSLLIPHLFNNNNEKVFKSYDELIETSRLILLKLNPKDELTSGIIAAHPRLGVPANLSSHSNSEQKSIYSGDNDADKIIKQFIELNERYEQTFPGLRYVLFVNGRSKVEIVDDFEKRIKRNDYDLEVKEALNAMCDIAKSRADKLLNQSSL